MSDMKTVRGRVETDIKRLLTLVQQLFEILLKNDLLDKSALAKLIDNVLCHNIKSFNIIYIYPIVTPPRAFGNLFLKKT